MTLYAATINIPGYLPQDDEPATFDTAREAWEYLADKRERDEDSFPDDGEYSDEWVAMNLLGDANAGVETQSDYRVEYGLNPDGTGTIYAGTPGYVGDHDLGLAYTVRVWVDLAASAVIDG